MSSVFRTAGGRIVTPRATDEFGHTSATSVLVDEEKDAYRVAGRRERVRDRRERFLDARERTIGIDVEALDRQVAEKAAARKAERDAELAYAEEQRRIARAIAEFELEVSGDKRAKQAATAQALRTQVVTKQQADTYDLNDKDALKKDRPARDGDEDPRCGPASLQRFTGEDPYEADRVMMQAAQMRQWAIAQQREKEAALAAERDEDKEYAAYLEAVGQMRDQVETAVKKDAADRAMAMKLENERMARERRELEARAKAVDAKISQQELEASVTGGILTEDFADAASTLGPHRKRRDYYRGMTEEEYAKWKAELDAQRKEQAARAEAERKADMDAAAEQARFVREARRMEVELARQREEERQQYVKALELQKREQAARMEAEARENKSLYIGRGFYDGFGQSDR